MEFMTSLDWPTLFQWAFALIGAASTIAAVTPTPADDNALAALRKVLDALAFNFGHAQNKDRDE